MKDKKFIISVLNNLSAIEWTDIVPFLLSQGFNREKAWRLVKFLRKEGLAEVDNSHELSFIKIAESVHPVILKNLYIKAKITIKGEEYIETNTGNLRFKFEKRHALYIAVPLIIITTVLGFFTDWFSLYPMKKSKNEAFTFTIFVHGREGQDDLILKEGEVRIDLDGDPRTSPINEKGEATFKEVPGKFEGDSIKVNIVHEQPYRPIDLNHQYILKRNQPIYVPVRFYYLDSIYGTVVDSNTNIGIDSIRVSIRKISTYTDKHGYYELKIPPEYQKEYQKVRFEKFGYKPKTFNNIPIFTRQSMDVKMKKVDDY